MLTIFRKIIKKPILNEPAFQLSGVVIAVLLVFSPTLMNKLQVFWDDQWVVVNVYTDAGLTRDNIRKIFTEYYHGQYAPINQLTYTLLHTLFGYKPIAFHLVSLLIHAMNVLLVYNLIKKILTINANFEHASVQRIALFTALLFGIHPFNVEKGASTKSWFGDFFRVIGNSLAAVSCYATGGTWNNGQGGSLTFNTNSSAYYYGESCPNQWKFEYLNNGSGSSIGSSNGGSSSAQNTTATWSLTISGYGGSSSYNYNTDGTTTFTGSSGGITSNPYNGNLTDYYGNQYGSLYDAYYGPSGYSAVNYWASFSFPWTGSYPPSGSTTTPAVLPTVSKDPCVEKTRVSGVASMAKLVTQNADILSKTTSIQNTNKTEYGADRKLYSLAGTELTNETVRTDNSTNTFITNFTWDATNGYSIGSFHGHPEGTAPSPQDALWAARWLDFPGIKDNAEATRIYKDYVSVTVITSTASYIITVKDWAALTTAYTYYKSQNYSDAQNHPQNHVVDQYTNFGIAYGNINQTASDAEVSEYALLKLYAGALNIYKAPAGSTTYVPLEINANNKVATKICP